MGNLHVFKIVQMVPNSAKASHIAEAKSALFDDLSFLLTNSHKKKFCFKFSFKIFKGLPCYFSLFEQCAILLLICVDYAR